MILNGFGGIGFGDEVKRIDQQLNLYQQIIVCILENSTKMVNKKSANELPKQNICAYQNLLKITNI